MDREKAKAILQDGRETLFVDGSWFFTGLFMTCGNYTDDEISCCCEGYYKDVEEALDTIEMYAGNNWSKVEEA